MDSGRQEDHWQGKNAHVALVIETCSVNGPRGDCRYSAAALKIYRIESSHNSY